MFTVGTAGHVDHGKSTLIEALTGIDPDRLREEKARGMTIDLGFAWLRLPDGREISIVDVPGHERFIKNMLAGVGGIDAALLVIAADEGIMPQTREHLDILDLIGVNHGVVALTKADLVDDEWRAFCCRGGARDASRDVIVGGVDRSRIGVGRYRTARSCLRVGCRSRSRAGASRPWSSPNARRPGVLLGWFRHCRDRDTSRRQP